MKKILLLYAFDYSGHHKACLALERAFLAVAPGVETRTAHVLETSHPFLARFCDESYFLLMRRFPAFWGYLYNRKNIARSAAGLESFVLEVLVPGLRRVIEEFRPDAVVCTQALAGLLISRYKERHRSGLPHFAVLTDFDAHGYWAGAAADEYIVPSEAAAGTLRRHGVPDARIRRIGIPIDPGFCGTSSVSTFAPDALPNVLVMGGSRGFISESLMRRLEGLPRHFRMTVMTGRNRRLYERLRRRARVCAKSMTVLPWIENVDEHMRGADVVVTKPGGLSISEVMTAGKPTVVFGALPGQEVRNARVLAGEGNMFFAGDEREAAHFVDRLLAEAPGLRGRSAISRPGAGGASSAIVRRVMEAL